MPLSHYENSNQCPSKKIKNASLFKKTFLLGVGSPKSGTTWLFNYLGKFDNINLGYKKEYHAFDTKYLDYCNHFLASNNRLSESGLETAFEKKHNASVELLQKLQANHDSYFNYFSDLVKQKGISITGDLTPTYCLLPKEHLISIRKMIISHRMRPRVIFIMRDPVEKIWSSARMNKRLGKNVCSGHKIDRSSDTQTIAKALQSEKIAVESTKYSEIVSTLNDVFLDKELYFGFYESMHHESEINRLSHFLGLEPQYDFSHKIINGTPMSDHDQPTEDIIKNLTNFYLDEYIFCKKFFPDANINKIWPHYSYAIQSAQLK